MLRGLAIIGLLAALGGGVVRRDAAEPADLVVLNAKIVTVDDRFREAQALAVRGGRFVAVGSTDEVRARIGGATRVIDGGGRTVIPGLIDSHVHALGVAAAEASQPFQNLRSIGELQDWIRATARRVSRGRGSGRRVSIRHACASAVFPPVGSWTRRRRIIRLRSMAPTRCRSIAWRYGLPA